MYQALYRKYRPQTFDDVYGQTNIVNTLKNAIINNKLSHAYLFCGPRGTGKTSVAKIIARTINCENLVDATPCNKCVNCTQNTTDIIEIDAASNNGVDEIRELKNKISLVPTYGKYKIYIIDEVHMLTTQAFNALLKTLEEPPSHVIFILATTEPHKIPLTIASRCQKFRFSKIDDKKIVERLREISNLEDITIDDDALYEIARLSDGGMRDAINFLDQLVAYSNDNITIDDVYKVNGSVSYEELYTLLDDVKNNNKVKLIEFVDYLDESGKDINKFVEEMLIFLKDVILYKNANILSSISTKNDYIKLVSDKYNDKDLYDLIESLNGVQNSIKISNHSSIIFMISILKYSDLKFGRVAVNNEKIISREIIKEKNENISQDRENISQDKENISREIKDSSISDDQVELRVNNSLALASKNVLEEFKSKWNSLDDYIDDEEFSVVSGLLKDSNIVVGASKYVILSCNYPSTASRINSNLEVTEKLLEKIFDTKVYVVAVDNDRWKGIKNKYIDDLKKGIKYNVKEIENNANNKREKSSIDDLIDLVGDSIIEYK